MEVTTEGTLIEHQSQAHEVDIIASSPPTTPLPASPSDHPARSHGCGHRHGKGCSPSANHPDSPQAALQVSSWEVFWEPGICLVALIVGIWLDRNGSSIKTGWNPALIAYLISFAAGGGHTLWHALTELRHCRMNIDLLMVLAALGAALGGNWPEGAVLLFLFSLSHALEDFIMGRTRGAIAALMKLTPEVTTVIRNEREETIRVEDLRVGDLVIVRPSERVPADGIVRLGATSIDQSPMTGESIPVDKLAGDPVFAGTLNQQGMVHMEVTRCAGETTLARMVHLVEQAQSERAESQQFTEWFGERYTWLVLAGAIVILLGGLFVLNETFRTAFHRAITALVVASPCAVVISIPAAILSAVTSAARGGVLIKGGSHLERMAKLKTMAFDKTGTLTIGRPRLTSLFSAPGYSETDVMTAAAALERHSEHPLAKAVVEAAVARGINMHDFSAADQQSGAESNVHVTVGKGIEADWQGRRWRAGNVDWLVETGSTLGHELAQATSSLRSDGQTTIGLADESRVVGVLGVADQVRPTASAAIERLRELGFTKLVVLSGDHGNVVERITKPLRIEGQGGLMPEDKLKLIGQLRSDHGDIGMIGDGMNDAPSLAAANVGFSLGGAGTDVALETADIVLLADDLRRLPYAIGLAREAQRIIKQNLILAFGTMLGLLIVTLFSQLPLPLAVLGHEGSTVLVILNGLRLLAYPKPPPLTSSPLARH